jgi:phospholipid/cholesterol/gamma-HCH transport system substrate-binding protein
MLKYRGTQLIKRGFIGAVLLALVIAVGLDSQRLWSMATSLRYHALFSEAGGLVKGNDVTVAGIKVGSVSEVALSHGDALVTFVIDGRVRLGSDTTAHIRTGTLLGQRVLTLNSAGSARLRSSDVISKTHTSTPYSLTDAVSDLTANVAGTDTSVLNQSLDSLSTTIDAVSPQLGATFDGLTRLSRALNSRDQTLDALLRNARDVTAILSDRSQQLNTLILDANDLLDTLVQRRHVIVELLANTSAVARQLSGLVHDNEAAIGPTLDKLNAVTAVLQKNRDNIAKALPGLAKYEITDAEALANGPYYNAYIANLAIGEFLQPFLDYALGFRRGVDAGQPPDNAGPRAEIPFPYNGIPQPNEQWGR